MTLTGDALTWQGVTIGGPDSDLLLDGGVEGLGRVGAEPATTGRSTGGVWGGLSVPGPRTVTTEAWLDADRDNERDFSPLWDIDAAMQERALPTDELPLAWAGFMWPEGEFCVFARPTRCEWLTDEEGTHQGSPGLDLRWFASDSTRYDYEQTTAALWTSESPVTSDEFEAANSGLLVPSARHSWDFRMTARGGPVVDPFMRVDHGDDTFEQITFEGTLGSGLTLTVGSDLVPRIGSQIASGMVRSLTELGIVARAPRWWLLHPSTGSDEANVVTIGAASGSFSGYVKTRGGR